MHKRLKAFCSSRRSAVTMIFALSFIPLMYLVGLSVDFTFYSLASGQAQLAAQGAATNAVRAAVSTYTLETDEGISASPTATPSAYNDGITAGEQAGYMWFQAQLGKLPRGSISFPGAATSVNYPKVVIAEPSAGGGYAATVTYTLTYPPLFNGLFSRASSWTASGNTQATSNFDYAEILFLLDSSNSMLIGTSPTDITTMEENSVCQPSTILDSTITTGEVSPISSQYTYGQASNNGTADNDAIDFTQVAHYKASGSTDENGSCNSGYLNSSFSGPMVPCALACHTTSATTSSGYYKDLYGLARQMRATEISSGYTSSPYGTNPALSLRIDIVMDSALTAINDMETAEAFTGQFTAGVYNFTDDIATPAIATGTTGDSTPEATSLTKAASDVQAVDYIYAPETSFPSVYNSGTRNTDFVTSMASLLVGKTKVNQFGSASVSNVTRGGTAISAVSTATAGQTASNPLKFLFIITDGLNDVPNLTTYYPTSNHYFGEMTSYTNETAQNSAAVCYPYKSDGFTIYVLAIQYYPLDSTNYYNKIPDYPTAYTTQDYPTEFSNVPSTRVQDLVTTNATSSETSPPNSSQYSPVDIGLRACASSSSDFYTAAGGASTISNAIDTMLRSALASTIRLSN